MDLRSKPAIAGAMKGIGKLQQKPGKETGRLKGIKFGWNVNKETTDRQ